MVFFGYFLTVILFEVSDPCRCTKRSRPLGTRLSMRLQGPNIEQQRPPFSRHEWLRSPHYPIIGTWPWGARPTVETVTPTVTLDHRYCSSSTVWQRTAGLESCVLSRVYYFSFSLSNRVSFLRSPVSAMQIFVLDFSFPDFFLALKFFSRIFSWRFSPLFFQLFPDCFLDFFHRWSRTSKAHSWVEVLRDMTRFDFSWLCNYFIYCWKYRAVKVQPQEQAVPVPVTDSAQVSQEEPESLHDAPSRLSTSTRPTNYSITSAQVPHPPGTFEISSRFVRFSVLWLVITAVLVLWIWKNKRLFIGNGFCLKWVPDAFF